MYVYVCMLCMSVYISREVVVFVHSCTILYLILMSIVVCSLILVPDPYFNEPGWERTMNTPQGNIESKKYNDNIRDKTCCFAILEQMKSPPPFFTDVIQQHFALKKQDILQQLIDWNISSALATKIRVELGKLPAIADLKQSGVCSSSSNSSSSSSSSSYHSSSSMFTSPAPKSSVPTTVDLTEFKYSKPSGDPEIVILDCDDDDDDDYVPRSSSFAAVMNQDSSRDKRKIDYSTIVIDLDDEDDDDNAAKKQKIDT